MYKTIFIILITLALSAMACSIGTIAVNPGGQIQGSGNVVSENRSVSGFTSIALQGSANVYVTIGDTESVVVKTDDNILPLIETRVQNGQLIISTKDNTSFTTSADPVRVDVAMKSLDDIKLSGSGIINVPELNGEAINVNLPGSGNINVAGEVAHANINLGGSGIVSCSGLKAKSATVNLSGSGNVKVYASDSLDATLSGSGTIQYSGNPTNVSKNVTGSGSITP
jgi:hypothetical protein